MTALIYSPFPAAESADRAAETLLNEKLIVCANRLGAVHSLFDWRGARENAEEVGVLFKTDAGCLAAAVARLEAIHPYEAPAICGWICDAPGAAMQSWTGALAGVVHE